ELTPAGIDTFFYANSGAEITEAAVKLAKQATGRPHVIVFQGSFHGRTHQAMAMTTSKTGYRAGHAPLPSGVFIAPYPDVRADDVAAEVDRAIAGFDDLLTMVTAPSETAAVIIEPVLGEGGYTAAPAGFLEAIDERCKAFGILFVADEVQSGFGRTGKMFAIEHYDVSPDIVCMAKGIASGFPFSALGTRRELDDKWPTGSHGGTYGGNPIGCAAALATIDVLTADGFLDHVNERGAQLTDGLRALGARHDGMIRVRALGLMVAADFDTAARTAAVVNHCRQHGKLIVMTAGAAGTTLRFMPPLTVSPDEIDIALAAIDKALVDV
ncbi:MAG: aminotransferase class III-fold pyridoxal phosphate-dependent enzyme, partial [Ilumatobacteraceae bacterium]